MSFRFLSAPLYRLLSPLACLFICLHHASPARAVEEGLKERWGDLLFVFREPVVSQTVVKNCSLLALQERKAQVPVPLSSEEEEDEAEYEEEVEVEYDEEEEEAPTPKLTAADCGLDLFTVKGTPAPRLRWVDQNKLRIEFAPGSSPGTEYRVDFKPGLCYLGGAPVETKSFTCRPKPVALRASMLMEHAGGAALLMAAHADTLEAQQLAGKHEGLQVAFRRMRHFPLIGWVCTGTVPARLEPATVENALTASTRREVMEVLMSERKPASLRADTVLPRCLLVRPAEALKPGAHYELAVEAAEGSGFENAHLYLGVAPGPLKLSLSPSLEAKATAAGVTRLVLRVDRPVPGAQLRELWQKMGVSLSHGGRVGVGSRLHEDGSYHLGRNDEARLSLLRVLPCEAERPLWRREGERFYYAPAGCGMGLELELESAEACELSLHLPPLLRTRHGIGMEGEGVELQAMALPACPVLTGNGCNEVALSGSHLLRLPFINVGGVKATAYHWEAEAAARLLPLIHRGMGDDTTACELLLRLDALERRAEEGLPTGRERRDLRHELRRALRLLDEDRRWRTPLRERALSEASVYPTTELELQPQGGDKGLVQKGEALLDLDKLTDNTLRPGLYLISLTAEPNAAVRRALSLYRQEELQKLELPTCTVDYLVMVTDVGARLVSGELLVNSLATGEPLEGVELSAYQLPEVSSWQEEKEDKDNKALVAEASPLKDDKGQPVPTLTMKQGSCALPADWKGSLLLLRRGEDYSLCSLSKYYTLGRYHHQVADGTEVDAFCDRPLYRPGEVAHLRGVMRHRRQGELVIPEPCELELHFRKPNGEEIETRTLTTDAFGAFAADFRLPEGEEDVTGHYRCEVAFKGKKQIAHRAIIPCEVFRRDAFRATLRLEVAPVSPKEYSVIVEAVDYNGTPVARGKVELEISSSVELPDEGGETDEDGTTLTCELLTDDAGRAEWKGQLGELKGRQGSLEVTASVANDREEYVELNTERKTLAPADFLVSVGNSGRYAGMGKDDRLFLIDARSGEPLDRAQELELRVTVKDTKRRELPCGFYRLEPGRRELLRRRITVPAHCRKGFDLRAELGEDIAAQLTWETEYKVELCGQDAAGNTLCWEGTPSMGHSEKEEDGEKDYTGLKVEGRQVRLMARDPFEEARQLHVCVNSATGRRHTLAAVEAGADSVVVPLEEKEYGQVYVTAILCDKDAWGTYRNWHSISASGYLPRPDKTLKVEFTLPQGAKPGQQVELCGRVCDAGGKPVKAAVTLFAVDAGMMSVAPYTLPDWAASFYKGNAGSVSIEGPQNRLLPGGPKLIGMPDVWDIGNAAWSEAQAAAEQRFLCPPYLRTEAFAEGLGSLCHQRLSNIMYKLEDDLRWIDLFNIDELMGMEYQAAEGENMYCCESAPAPMAAPVVVEMDEECDGLGDGLGASGSAMGAGVAMKNMRVPEGALPSWGVEQETESTAFSSSYCPPMGGESTATPPRMRRNFEPVALWLASVETGEDGSFCARCTLPDTLTTYKVCAVALDASGTCFGKGEGEFLVNQELMLTAGTPFFMSTGDKLLLPLTLTNNQDEAGEWDVWLCNDDTAEEWPAESTQAGERAVQRVALEGRRSTTLYFEVEAKQEGSCTLRWTAVARTPSLNADAVEGSFPVRYPAPLLKEVHRLALAEGAAEQATASLLAPELAGSTRGSLVVEYSTSPLLHLAGSMDYLLSYPYGCTEQRASALLPWLFYEQLAPFCPQMEEIGREKAREVVVKSIAQILARQQKDGGLSYWAPAKGERAESCDWASGYAALVLTIAAEQGFAVPEEPMKKLRDYLSRQNWHEHDPLTQYAVARALGKEGEMNRILVKALKKELELAEKWGFRRGTVDLEFMAELSSNPAGRHEALLRWMRSKGRDYRHHSSWSGGWTLIALAEYLRLEPQVNGQARLCLNGEEHAVEGRPGRVNISLAAGQCLSEVAPKLAAGTGTVYVRVSAKAQPEQTDYPGVTEKGLQVTRLYEVQGADGQWRPASEFRVGDVVRVTLTCAKIADELEYFVLEDYLPACMEAINPNVPGQAAGLEDGGWGLWSPFFDHKEYLADRVRGFCTRWWGRDVVNMSYYARVKRAGVSTAPPAEAQLMYEPQTYGLSPNARCTSHSAQDR